jgi:protein KRI1
MPTRFKYTRSKPTAFGLTPAEILLATDKELDQIASLRIIAPYRKHGLGMQGRGISKRIYDLKQKLKNRKWGEEMEYDEDGKPRTIERDRDAGWGDKTKKRKADGEEEGGGEGGKKKKRLGKKQRERERAAMGADGMVPPAEGTNVNGNRYEEPVVVAEAVEGKEGKTRRKKKKSSQQKEELKIFD